MPGCCNLLKQIIKSIIITILIMIIGILGGILISIIAIPILVRIVRFITDNEFIINTIASSVGISCLLIGGIIGCIIGVLYIINIIKNDKRIQLSIIFNEDIIE